MPIYQFKCPECGHKSEDLMKHGDPNPNCLRCESRVTTVAHGYAAYKKVVMEKLFPTGTSFELKGEGWYKDGYSKNAKKAVKKESPKKEKAKVSES